MGFLRSCQAQMGHCERNELLSVTRTCSIILSQVQFELELVLRLHACLLEISILAATFDKQAEEGEIAHSRVLRCCIDGCDMRRLRSINRPAGTGRAREGEDGGQ